jgi:Mrp family chromosome partitioning ATPase
MAIAAPVDDLWRALNPLPTDTKILQKNRIFFGEARTGEAASFDLLRTKVLLQMEKNGWKRLAVTSAGSRAGKSTVCCNLASSIARQQSIRAIFLDLDMRNPSMAKKIGAQPKSTVAELMTGGISFAEHASRLGPNVALALNARPVKDPSDVFLDEATGSFLQKLESDYQPNLMVFDVPPMFVNDDATAIFSHVDCVMIVVDAERSTVPDLDRCEKEVADHANVLGMVLNKCRFPDAGYGYGYGYGKNS